MWYFTRSAFGREFFSSIELRGKNRNGVFGVLKGEAEMVEAEVRRGTQNPIPELEVLWMTAGLGCDGDTIAMTAATQPSIEDSRSRRIPWIPKVNLHNPFLAMANGDDFLRPFHQAAEGKIENFILVVEGSIPNEHNKEEGYWASFGTDPKTGQPITTCEWIDRLAAHAWAVVAAGTCATYGGIHAMEGNPTGMYGSSRLPGLAVEVEGGDSHRVRSRMSGAAR